MDRVLSDRTRRFARNMLSRREFFCRTAERKLSDAVGLAPEDLYCPSFFRFDCAHRGNARRPPRRRPLYASDRSGIAVNAAYAERKRGKKAASAQTPEAYRHPRRAVIDSPQCNGPGGLRECNRHPAGSAH